LLPIKYKTCTQHRPFCLSQSHATSSSSQCKHAFVILQRTQLQELAVCESGGREQTETKHFEAHLHADSVSPSTALVRPLPSLAQPAVVHSQSSVGDHATVDAARCGSLSITKKTHGPGQKKRNKYLLRHCIINHSSACANIPDNMTVSTSQSTQLLC